MVCVKDERGTCPNKEKKKRKQGVPWHRSISGEFILIIFLHRYPLRECASAGGTHVESMSPSVGRLLRRRERPMRCQTALRTKEDVEVR